MAQVIYKYPLMVGEDGDNIGRALMPDGAKVLGVGLEHTGQPVLWAQVDKDAKPKPRRFVVIPTGADIDENLKYGKHLGTAWLPGMVWHIFDPVATTAAEAVPATVAIEPTDAA